MGNLTPCVCVSCSAMSNSLQPHGLQPASLLCSWDSAGKNTGVGRHSLFQGISPTQGLNLGLLHCGQILYHLSHQGGLTRQHIWWIPDLILQHICVYLVCVHDPFCMTAYLWVNNNSNWHKLRNDPDSFLFFGVLHLSLGCAQLFAIPWTVAHQTPLSMGFSRQEYWSGVPFPSSRDLHDPGFQPTSPVSPALQADSWPLSHWGSPYFTCIISINPLNRSKQ